jgi:hypothetical protein
MFFRDSTMRAIPDDAGRVRRIAVLHDDTGDETGSVCIAPAPPACPDHRPLFRDARTFRTRSGRVAKRLRSSLIA